MTTPVARRILIAGTHSRNLELLSKFIEKLGYVSLRALGIAQLDEMIESSECIDLALIDVTGFDASIWTRCQRFYKKDILFLIISAHQSNHLQNEGIIHGANSVLVKPLVMHELTRLIQSLLAR